jgi:hypothetical protein
MALSVHKYIDMHLKLLIDSLRQVASDILRLETFEDFVIALAASTLFLATVIFPMIDAAMK